MVPGPGGVHDKLPADVSVSVGRNLWICDIHGSRCAIYESLVRAGIHGCLRNLWILRSRSTGSLYRPYLNLTFYELILLDRFQYM